MENPNEQFQLIEERTNKAWHEIVTMEERLSKISEQANENNQTLQEFQQTLITANEQIANLNSHYVDYFAKTDPLIKTKLEIVLDHHQTIELFQKNAEEIKKELEDFKEYIYGNNTLGKIGLKKEIETFFETKKNENENLNKVWSGAYQTLYNKIEGLLPGATSTGLSKAYQEQKEKYKSPVNIWSSVFISTVLIMMVFGIFAYADSRIVDIKTTLQHILARLPFFIPAIWLAIFASKQQSQYKRLQQEYVYKETLAKSFEAYKREIDLLPEQEEKNKLNQKLIFSMVEMCGYNPSHTLEYRSHNDKPPIPGNGILNSILKVKNANNETEE